MARVMAMLTTQATNEKTMLTICNTIQNATIATSIAPTSLSHRSIAPSR